MKGEIKIERRKRLSEKIVRAFLFSISAAVFLLFPACNYSPLESSKPAVSKPPEKEISSFERDLETMRTANFPYIYAFRRKDGAAFDAEDKKFLRANTPPETNRFVSTEEGKAFVAGSSYKFTAQHLENLAKRFSVEDYSAQIEELPATDQNRKTETGNADGKKEKQEKK